MITRRTILSFSRPSWSCTGARHRIAVAVILLITSISALGLLKQSRGWREWKPDEVRIAFWAWHSNCPGEEDVLRAVKEARAQTLFLRAGQIDARGGKPERIRAVTGRLPRNIDIHFVYNATRGCLPEFERLSAIDLATVLCGAYQEDTTRAAQDNARVAGLQLDIDVPTRLLPIYTKLLKATREMLPSGSQLSITGLPTWTDSEALRDTLAAVDFWIPQCYGARIPETLGQSQSQSVSSVKQIAAAIARARLLNRPYYAGLAAYGYAIQYARDNSLIALRGDLDPALVADDPNFELVSRGTFEQSDAAEPGRWRCIYRARNDGVIDGTSINAGDNLMLDVPTSASLREGASIARSEGGDQLLGLCVFRLPRQNDPTTLTIKEVASAMAGEETCSSFDIEAKLEAEPDRQPSPVSSRVRLRIFNDGSASSRPGPGAMNLLLHVPGGSVRALSSQGDASVESHHDQSEFDENETALCPSSLHRANVLAISANFWRPGQQAVVVIDFADEAPETLRANLTVILDDGRVLRQQRTIKLRAANQP